MWRLRQSPWPGADRRRHAVSGLASPRLLGGKHSHGREGDRVDSGSFHRIEGEDIRGRTPGARAVVERHHGHVNKDHCWQRQSSRSGGGDPVLSAGSGHANPQSCAPRLAERKAIHAGKPRRGEEELVLVLVYRFATMPMPSTNAKYSTMMDQSRAVRFMRAFTRISLILATMYQYGGYCGWLGWDRQRENPGSDSNRAYPGSTSTFRGLDVQ